MSKCIVVVFKTTQLYYSFLDMVLTKPVTKNLHLKIQRVVNKPLFPFLRLSLRTGLVRLDNKVSA